MGITSANATVTIDDQTMLLSDLMPGIHSPSSCAISPLVTAPKLNRGADLAGTFWMTDEL